MKLWFLLPLMLTGCAVAVQDDAPPPTGTFQPGEAPDSGSVAQGAPPRGCTYIYVKDQLPHLACIPPGGLPFDPFPTRGDPPPVEARHETAP